MRLITGRFEACFAASKALKCSQLTKHLVQTIIVKQLHTDEPNQIGGTFLLNKKYVSFSKGIQFRLRLYCKAHFMTPRNQLFTFTKILQEKFTQTEAKISKMRLIREQQQYYNTSIIQFRSGNFRPFPNRSNKNFNFLVTAFLREINFSPGG